LDGYAAVILAHGATNPNQLRVPGADLAGVEDATSFLTRAKQALQEGTILHDLLKGSQILVVGAGDTGMDVARTALRLGIKSVAIRRMEERFASVRPDELIEAREEGVEIRFARTVQRLVGDANGRVQGVWLQRTRQTKASETPKVLPESEYLPVDRVIVAAGYRVDRAVAASRVPNLPLPQPDLSREVPDRLWLASGILSTPSPIGRQALVREEQLEQASVARAERVWVVGDALTGPSTVVTSMAQGREAARAILHQYGSAG
ncbi:MAG TPA: FAD-dependent oxidoreductase, partial [Chloroflexota bacterium]|nr:FAD-dependent oxidoreductase [Chloroflexota bacterium]